jgi:hypothetical protein
MGGAMQVLTYEPDFTADTWQHEAAFTLLSTALTTGQACQRRGWQRRQRYFGRHYWQEFPCYPPLAGHYRCAYRLPGSCG